MTGLDALHPTIRYHLINTLGWQGLRPLQAEAAGPLVSGRSALLMAPTAGGKTEAAVLPLLSRMLGERWDGLSVLYVAPLRALLNNVEPRLQFLAAMVGRRAALWHGDVSASDRRRIERDPPDILLTTPESLEAILISVRRHPHRLFQHLHAVIIDEAHAFAASDRGWHLRAILVRLERLTGSALQRIGLSATVGDPAQVAVWLAGEQAQVIGSGLIGGDASLNLDHVGTLAGAAAVIAGLHRGEKRLVFCDSRSRVEQLGAALRRAGVETFLSHGSLARDERARAEDAFAQARDCVIVATSTLELGLDVGDLDRVIQIDAPATVSSFLQRLGRTGRRQGAERNCLFLATSQAALMQAAALCRLFSEGWVEPSIPPPRPVHLVVQQMLALCLQDGTWPSRELAACASAALGEDARTAAEPILEHLLDQGLLSSDGNLVQLGPEAERRYGGRKFRDLMAAFLAENALVVRAGPHELGQVDPRTLAAASEAKGQPSILLLGGRAWAIKAVDWRRRVVQVEPAQAGGKAHWPGAGPGLSWTVCQAMRQTLVEGPGPGIKLSRRAADAFQGLADAYDFLDASGSVLARYPSGATVWWTFAGIGANLLLGHQLKLNGETLGRITDTAINLKSHPDARTLRNTPTPTVETCRDAAGALFSKEPALKFAKLLPPAALLDVLADRHFDLDGARSVLSSAMRDVVFVPE